MPEEQKGWSNPRNPHSSPLKVTHTGWQQTKYHTGIQPREHQETETKPFLRNRVERFSSPAEYQASKTEDAQIDKRLDAAIKKDLSNRNIKPKTNKEK